VERKWYVVDAEDVVLGRLATRVASILRGKHRPIFTPHVDTGEHVIVINAEKVKLTGRKLDQKIYHRHTGYPGGIRSITAGKLLESSHSDRVVKSAVKGMLPKNSLGRQMFRKLKVYSGPDHPHEAQKPEELRIV
jgi:large subunit ribosomal protein L13